MKKKRVLILQGPLMRYRIPTWNILAEKYDLTVGYYEKGFSEEYNLQFKVVKLPFRRIGVFDIIKGVRRLAKQFDVVCFLPDPHILSYALLPFLPHNYKLITWSIGFRCSYTHPYDINRKHTIIDNYFYKRVFNSVDANIFYMHCAKQFWKEDDIDQNKVFVAPNTTGVESITIDASKKRNFIFVGTLYKDKGVEVLLDAFRTVINSTGAVTKLFIIGSGEMKDFVDQYVVDNNLDDNVVLAGAIFDEKVLANYFSKSLLCISPNQGGLSCPKSMGYGVPFVCREDAITGGEIYHMINGVSGVMYKDDTELTSLLMDAIKNPDKYIQMGVKAKEYYDTNATPSHMANGFIDAIEYALRSK